MFNNLKMENKIVLWDIDGMEASIKLDSSHLDTAEYHEQFEVAVRKLIEEIVGDQFQLKANIINKNAFAISISALPSQDDVKRYQINFDVGLFKMIYDGFYIMLSDSNVFSGMGISHSKFDVPTLNVPDWNSLNIAMANNDTVYFSANG